jgi:FKBP-type peptidyl-prolyl cis-trans isomerase
MRVGGRRELIVPAKESYGHTAEIYVLELAAVR